MTTNDPNAKHPDNVIRGETARPSLATSAVSPLAAPECQLDYQHVAHQGCDGWPLSKRRSHIEPPLAGPPSNGRWGSSGAEWRSTPAPKFDEFDCHFDGDWKECDKSGCLQEKQCKRRTSAPSSTAAKEYAERNPLGGPATVFDAIAERLRAGEEYHAVLADYGLAVSARAVNLPTGLTRDEIQHLVEFHLNNGHTAQAEYFKGLIGVPDDRAKE